MHRLPHCVLLPVVSLSDLTHLIFAVIIFLKKTHPLSNSQGFHWLLKSGPHQHYKRLDVLIAFRFNVYLPPFPTSLPAIEGNGGGVHFKYRKLCPICGLLIIEKSAGSQVEA